MQTRFHSLLRALALLSSALFVAGCASPPIPPEVIASADYGPPPSEAHQQIIRQRFDRILIDPTSPLYEFDEPRKGYTKPSSVFGTTQTFGWRVCGTINSKNRYGGYTGRSPFFVLFRGDAIVAFISGQSGSGGAITNAAIEEACRR